MVNIKWLLIRKDNNIIVNSHIIDKEPDCGEPKLLKWVEWNKPLPDDIDSKQYKYTKGKLEAVNG